MKKKQIFNNLKVTRLLKEYVTQKKKDDVLRNRILLLTVPLVDATIARYGMYRSKEDIRQECILKVLQAIPKFDARRGDAFGFMWATICNMSKSVNKRLHRPVSSLSTDEEAQREAEMNGKEVFQTPENQFILNQISAAVIEAFNSNGFRVPERALHRKVCKSIQVAMLSGEFFFNKNETMRKLRDLGLERKDVQFYCQRSLIVVREKLLEAKQNVDALTYNKISKGLSSISSGGDL